MNGMIFLHLIHNISINGIYNWNILLRIVEYLEYLDTA